MRASILLFATTLIVGSFSLTYLQSQQVSFFGNPESVNLAKSCKSHRCKEYRGSGRRNQFSLKGGSFNTTLV